MKKFLSGIIVAASERRILRLGILFSRLLVSMLLVQAAPSFSKNAEKGVHIAEFKTKAGVVRIFLPDDIAAGDTVSASIALYPAGVTRDTMDGNLGILSGYIIETSFFKVPAGQKSVKITVPRNAAGTEMRFTLRDASMKSLGSASVPIALSSPGRGNEDAPTPYDYQCPLVGQAGRIVEIKGPFDGDFATTDFKIGSKEAKVVAESPRKLVFESPSDVIGSVEVVLVERNVEVRRPYTCLQVLKIGEGDTVPVGSAAGTSAPALGMAPAVSDEPLSRQKVTERELPPATQSLEFRSIKAEENMPIAEPVTEAPARIPVPGDNNERIMAILASQMDSALSPDSPAGAAYAPSGTSVQSGEKDLPPQERTGEYLEESEITIGTEKPAGEQPPPHAAQPGDTVSVSGNVPGGSAVAVIESQLLASFTGGPPDEGLKDAPDYSAARPPSQSC